MSNLLRAALLAGAGLVSSLGTTAAGIAHADSSEPTRVSLRPSDARGNEVAGPGYFTATAGPGSTVQLYALVGNKSRQQAAVSVLPVDARSGVFGGISFDLPQQRRLAVGSWVKVLSGRVKIAAGQGVVVPFTVTVPRNAQPGQYIGGLSVFVPPRKAKAGQFGGIYVQTRVVDAVVITVPGPTTWRFNIGSVGVRRLPNGVYLTIHIFNTGTGLLKGSGNLWIYPPHSGKPILQTKLVLDTTVPHTRVDYPIFMTKRAPSGKYRFAVTLTWNGGQTVKHGTFTVR